MKRVDKEFLKSSVDKEFLMNYWNELCSNIDTTFIYRTSSAPARIATSISHVQYFRVDETLMDRYIKPIKNMVWSPNKMLIMSIDIECNPLKNESFIEFEINQDGGEKTWRKNNDDDYSYYVKFDLTKEEYNSLYSSFEKGYEVYKKWYDNNFVCKFEEEVNKLNVSFKEEAKVNFEKFKKEIFKK